MSKTLTPELLEKMDAYWRATNYLSVGQIYLMDNPLLRESLKAEDVKPRLLGHWGTTPGLNFIYVHFNRAIVERDLDVIYIAGPGHGGPGLVANTYLEGSYSELYPDISQDVEGMQKLFKQFSFPGGIPSHVAPETPGSIHEGGELGYAVSHAYGAAFDNPDLVVCCVVGDGEAETGPLAASWHSNKFLNPVHDGAVILRDYRIHKAGAFLPLTRNPKIEKTLGTRHRAAIGITEETDSLAVVVSEERGTISLCMEGRIESGLDPDQLKEALLAQFTKPKRQFQIKNPMTLLEKPEHVASKESEESGGAIVAEEARTSTWPGSKPGTQKGKEKKEKTEGPIQRRVATADAED